MRRQRRPFESSGSAVRCAALRAVADARDPRRLPGAIGCREEGVGPRDPFETALTRVGRTATRAAESPHVLYNTSRSYLAMQHGRLRARGRGGEPTSLGVAMPHFAMPRAGKFWFQFPACGTAGAHGQMSATRVHMCTQKYAGKMSHLMG
jgi:hypothetical protein